MSITSSENILRILYSYNPWWREGYFPQDLSKPVKRVVYHQAFELLMHPTIIQLSEDMLYFQVHVV